MNVDIKAALHATWTMVWQAAAGSFALLTIFFIFIPTDVAKHLLGDSVMFYVTLAFAIGMIIFFSTMLIIIVVSKWRQLYALYSASK